MGRIISPSLASSRLSRRHGQRIGFAPNSPFVFSDSFTLAQLSNLVQRFLDRNPAYHNTLLQSLPIPTPEEPGTVAVPRGQRCALFDGSNDYATLGAALTASQSSATIAFWIKTTTTADRGVIGQWLTGGNNLSWLVSHSSTTAGTITLFLSSNGSSVAYSARTSGTVNDGNWHHVCITIVGSTAVTISIDNVAQSLTTSGSIPATLRSTSAAFDVGSWDSRASTFAGSLRDVRVYNVAKTAGEIAAIYNQASTPTTVDRTGLLGGWWLQEENVQNGGLHYDWSGNGKHLTATNITALTYNATDSGVTYNANNWFGYTLSGSVVIPANLSDISKDAAGNALGVVGPVCKPATVEVPCFTGDGTAAYVDCGSALIPATADFDLSVSYYHAVGNTTVRSIFDQRSSGSTGVIACVANNNGSGTANKLFLYLAAGQTIVSSIDLTPATWHLIRLVRFGNLFTLYVNGASAGTLTYAHTVSTSQTTTCLGGRSGASTFELSDGRIAGLSITTGGLTKYPLFDQCGPGSSNTNRDFYILGSDGSATLVSGGIVNGTIANIYANKCPYVKDWCIQYGGSHNPNMLGYSEQFDNAYWTKASASVTADSTTAPDGTSTADTITEIAGVSMHGAYRAFTSVSGASYTLSVSVKYISRQFMRIGIVTTGGAQSIYADVDVQNGLLINQGPYGAGASQSQASITSQGNGWYRVTITGSLTSTSAFVVVYGRGTSANLNPESSFNYSGTSSWCVWGAQLEAGSAATSYQANLTTPNGAFIPGRIGSGNDAAGNAKTLSAGKHGNPYSRLCPNAWSAPELVNIGYTSSTKLAPSDTVQATSPADTKFRRNKTDGSDRYFASRTALTGADKTNAESYVG